MLPWFGLENINIHVLSDELPKPSPVFLILPGSGMGLAHSGNLADFTLANLSDEWTLREEVMNKFVI